MSSSATFWCKARLEAMARTLFALTLLEVMVTHLNQQFIHPDTTFKFPPNTVQTGEQEKADCLSAQVLTSIPSMPTGSTCHTRYVKTSKKWFQYDLLGSLLWQ